MKATRAIAIVFVMQLIGLYSFSQDIIDSFEVCNLPVREGKIYEYDFRFKESVVRRVNRPGVSILTLSDSVLSFGEGQVMAVHRFDCTDSCVYAIVVRNDKDEYVVYSNLGVVFVRKGDVLTKGICVGLSGASDDGKQKMVDILILINSGKKTVDLPFRKTAEYIMCNKAKVQCEERSGYTL